MCTALTLCTRDHYFGRTLDLDCSYGEEVCVMPRRFLMEFRHMGKIKEHYALIGMATVIDNMPLFYDAANEYGLAMAGLNFPGNAYYGPVQLDMDNVAPFELIPWILFQCKNVTEARQLLKEINLANIPYSDNLPLSPLHWMISDNKESIVVEAMKDGLHIYDNPVGVMTNNPPFEYQLFNLNNYRNLHIDNGENGFSKSFSLSGYCQGLGAVGLPGDVSSMSRLVRAAFGREHSVCEPDEESSVSQFFHLLSSVEMNRGMCLTEAGTWDITVYMSCINMDRGLYYYTTYDNHRINCVDMHRTNLDAEVIIRFSLRKKEEISYSN